MLVNNHMFNNNSTKIGKKPCSYRLTHVVKCCLGRFEKIKCRDAPPCVPLLDPLPSEKKNHGIKPIPKQFGGTKHELH